MNADLHALASTQAGLFTSDQACACGYSAAAQKALVRSGQWRRVIRSVFALREHKPTLEDRCRALSLIGAGEFVISGRASLLIRGVASAAPASVVDVVIAPGAGPSSREGVIYRHGVIASVNWRGIRMATLAAAGVDLARREVINLSVPVLDEMLRRGLVSRAELQGRVDALDAGARGVRMAQSAVDRADGRAESPPESQLRLLLTDAGVAGLVAQHVVLDRRGDFVARVDLAIPELKIAIEYDGGHHQTDRATYLKDKRRQRALEELGWTVLVFTKEDLRGPSTVVATVLQTITRASA